MSKYTDEELKEMALTVVVDRNDGGMQSFVLISTLATVTGLDPNVVMDCIMELARS